MSKYQEVAAMLSATPTPKPITLGASVRIPVELLANITAMANRAGVSRNEIMTRLLDAAVSETFDVMAQHDPAAVADIQEEAGDLAASWYESIEPDEEQE